MQLEFVAIRETQASRILPKKCPALRVFWILFEQARPLALTSNGVATATADLGRDALTVDARVRRSTPNL